MLVVSLCRSFVVCRTVKRMASIGRSYEDAVQKLNLLQSNKANLEQIRKAIQSGNEKNTNLKDMRDYLMRTGISMSRLDELPVIHIAGTKGKGSTSAMCEAVLRAHGLRTGLYTSPHLVAVRERIRLDGAVVAREHFARHFHRLYDMLYATQAYEGDMPKYFAFLTVLAYHMFLEARVDVAVVEVGIGGVVDYTNVLRKVPVVGITALGLDHTSILGTTIEQIAAAKAGIMKQGCVAYTAPQPRAALAVLKAVADEVQCPLNIAPEYTSYTFPNNMKSPLPVDIDAYRTNASLAIQLAHAWMRLAKVQTISRRKLMKKQVVSGKIRQNSFIDIDPPYIDEIKTNGVTDVFVSKVPLETVIGLKDCRWPGRYQVIKADYATFYLDGAHTKESMEICAKWFEESNKNRDMFLIFSATGDRDAEVLLKPLTSFKFQTVFFVIPKAYKRVTDKSDNYSILEDNELISRCKNNADIWQAMHHHADSNIVVLESVSEALISIKRQTNVSECSVLITGSLHLVGSALSILDPSLNMD